MRALILAAAVALGTLVVDTGEAQAWTWGRFYGTGYYPSIAYTPGYYPQTFPENNWGSGGYSYYPSYQDYTYPSYNAYYPGYYNNYNLGYTSGIYAPPYRSYYSPGTVYQGYYRGY